MGTLFDDIADWSRIRRMSLGGAILAIAIGSIWGLVVGPVLSERTEIKAEVDANDTVITAKEIIAARLEAAQTAAALAKESVGSLNGGFRTQQEIDSLLEQVSVIAGEIGLDLELFQRKEELVKDFYVEVPTAVAISGRFHDVAVFIDRVTRLPGLLTFDRLSMAHSAKYPLGDRLKADFVLVAYRLLDKDESLAVGSANKSR